MSSSRLVHAFASLLVFAASELSFRLSLDKATALLPFLFDKCLRFKVSLATLQFSS